MRNWPASAMRPTPGRRPTWLARLVPALVLAVLLLPGCARAKGGRTIAPASGGVEAYIATLRADDPARAYALLSDDIKAQVSLDAFTAHWRASTAERHDQILALEEGLRSALDLDERTRVEYDDGKTIHLVREGTAWRLESAVVSQTYAGRPHDAVRIFAAALDRRDYAAILRILTERRRAGVGEQVDAFVRSLLDHLGSLDDAMELIGPDRAELRWDDESRRYRIILRKEGDEWRVDDIHLRPAPGGEDEE